MRYRTKVGSEFPVSEAIIRARTAHLREQVRSIVILSLLICSLGALTLAAAISLWSQNWSVLAYVWAGVSTVVGLPLSFYFGRQNIDGEDNDKGATGIA